MRDPYLLPFLGLADTYSESDLEAAILREIERFLLELGAGFTFIERQKRMTLDGDDHYLDLLFFHRRLRRLVAIELKLGDFKARDSGQMELYLRWLDKYERQPSEEPPLGIILCAGKKRETVEILDLDARGIHVAEYLTELPPRMSISRRPCKAIPPPPSPALARRALKIYPLSRSIVTDRHGSPTLGRSLLDVVIQTSQATTAPTQPVGYDDAGILQVLGADGADIRSRSSLLVYRFA